LESQPKEKGKYISDDTKLLYNIVCRKDILKHSSPKVFYLSRTSFKEILKHMFERGPRFVDYYLDPGKKNFWLFIFSPLLLFLTSLFAFIFFPDSINYLIFLVLILLVLASAFLADSLKGFFISIFLMPIFLMPFFTGVLKGLFLKLKKVLVKKYRKINVL
jgi:hypothetical protein